MEMLEKEQWFCKRETMVGTKKTRQANVIHSVKIFTIDRVRQHVHINLV